jgi:choline dehydrogenase-like flavoprotein
MASGMSRGSNALDILVIGTGVVGTVYGAWLAAAGNRVSALAHNAEPTTTRRLGTEDAISGHQSPVCIPLVTAPGETRWVPAERFRQVRACRPACASSDLHQLHIGCVGKALQ